jgi:hypothetical protein
VQSENSDDDSKFARKEEPFNLDAALEKLNKFAKVDQNYYPINHIKENVKNTPKIHKIKNIQMFYRNYLKENS